MKPDIPQQILKNTQITNFIKIRPVEGKLFDADSRTNRHKEANSCFLQFCGGAWKQKAKFTLQPAIKAQRGAEV